MRTCMNHVQFGRSNGLGLKEPTSRKESDWKDDGKKSRPPDDG